MYYLELLKLSLYFTVVEYLPIVNKLIIYLIIGWSNNI